jgi:hypothetical protein
MLNRIITFASFTLVEYIRSGRILIELAATVGFWAVFFRDRGIAPIDLAQFFSLSSIFTLLLSLYTATSLLSIGERPQGYLLLTRPLSRTGYLLGLYLVVVILVGLMFALLTGLTLIFNRPFDFTWLDLFAGTLPLLLNVTILAALLILLSSMVLSTSARLLVLALLAIALYSRAWHLRPEFRYIEPLQSLLSWPIYPALSGFRLSMTRDFSGIDRFTPIAQILLAVLLMAWAIAAFKRRDIILRDQ